MTLIKDRIQKIKLHLRMQSSPSTVTDIHFALSKRMNLEISRKTIERDLLAMIEKGEVAVLQGTPARFSLLRPLEIELCLKVEEIETILDLLSEGSELYLKLKKHISEVE